MSGAAHARPAAAHAASPGGAPARRAFPPFQPAPQRRAPVPKREGAGRGAQPPAATARPARHSPLPARERRPPAGARARTRPHGRMDEATWQTRTVYDYCFASQRRRRCRSNWNIPTPRYRRREPAAPAPARLAPRHRVLRRADADDRQPIRLGTHAAPTFRAHAAPAPAPPVAAPPWRAGARSCGRAARCRRAGALGPSRRRACTRATVTLPTSVLWRQLCMPQTPRPQSPVPARRARRLVPAACRLHQPSSKRCPPHALFFHHRQGLPSSTICGRRLVGDHARPPIKSLHSPTHPARNARQGLIASDGFSSTDTFPPPVAVCDISCAHTTPTQWRLPAPGALGAGTRRAATH